jgi:hypothetical protein
VNPTGVDRVVAYIQWQEKHHKTQIFTDEFLTFLHTYSIEYDENYVFD